MVSLPASRAKNREGVIRPARMAIAPEALRTNPGAQPAILHTHPGWEPGKGWKNLLNNLRLIIQPYVYYCLLYGWLEVFDLPFLKGGFTHLIARMNEFIGFVPV